MQIQSCSTECIRITMPSIEGHVILTCTKNKIAYKPSKLCFHISHFFSLMAYRKSIPLLNQLEGFKTSVSTCVDECGFCTTGQTCINTGTVLDKDFKCGVLCGSLDANKNPQFGLCPATIGPLGTTSPQTCEPNKAANGANLPNTFNCKGANCDAASPNGYCPYGGKCTPATDKQGNPTNICKV